MGKEAMSTLQYLKGTLDMTGTEFMREWRTLTDEEKEWYKKAAQQDAKVSGVALK